MRDGRGHCRVAAPHELHQAALKRATLQQDVAATGLAAQSDVGAQTIDEPPIAAARVGPPQTDQIAKKQREDRLCGHERAGYQRRG